MNNVVNLGNRAVSPQPHTDVIPASPILFNVWERPLEYRGKGGDVFQNTGHKGLIRMVDDKPVCLNVVKDTYKVVQNAELFDTIDSGLFRSLGTQAHDAQVIDQISYQGKTCMRQYIFPNISVDSPERDHITFRIIAVNGFGGSAVKLIAGAIDFFCTNGMIIGEYTREYAKHTSGLKIQKFEDIVKMSVDVFWKERATWTGLREKKITNPEYVKKFLDDRFGERLGNKILHQYLIEQRVRGGSNLWALYSAMTYYASHAVGDFGLRNTGNDHTAATMLKREHDVRNAFRHPEFMALAA